MHHYQFVFQVTVRQIPNRECTCAHDNDCCHFTVNSKLNEKEIVTVIRKKPGCTICKLGCCDFDSMRVGRIPHSPISPMTSVNIQMKRSCSECKGSCCDDVLLDGPRNLNKTSMITYL